MLFYLIAMVVVFGIVFMLNKFNKSNMKYSLSQEKLDMINFLSMIVIMVIATIGMINLVYNSLSESQCKKYIEGKIVLKKEQDIEKFDMNCQKYKI